MADNNSNTKKQQADTQFKKLQRAEDGKKAMQEYEADAVAARAKTARLRELRLARDAAEAAAPPVAAPAKKGAKTTKKKKVAGVPLSDWLKGQQTSGRNN